MSTTQTAMPTDAMKALTFLLNEVSYGIPIEHVTEIVGLQHITPIPNAPHHVKGVINLRGKVIPVIDVRARFGMPHREYDARTCIIVAQVDDSEIGLLIDRVQEVLDIPAGSIEDPPGVCNDGGQSYIVGLANVGDELRVLLDVQVLLFAEGEVGMSGMGDFDASEILL